MAKTYKTIIQNKNISMREYSMVSMRMMMEYDDARRKAWLGLDAEHTSGLVAISYSADEADQMGMIKENQIMKTVMVVIIMMMLVQKNNSNNDDGVMIKQLW